MANIRKEIKKEMERLENMMKVLEKFQTHAPEGNLKYQCKGEKTYYYLECIDEQTKQWGRKYIKKENSSLVRDLAQKNYCTVLKPILDKNLKELRRFFRQYQPEKLEEAYDGLSDERKKLIEPLPYTREAYIREWIKETYEKNNFYPENLRFETEQGEMVRSKSEVIIANILYQHKKEILYKYERPLEIFVDGRVKKIYPDFTILNVHTGRIVYWEHAGRIDDVFYMNEFVKKINAYIANDLLPGRDLVLTFETMENPLDVSVVKRLTGQVCGHEI